MSEIKKRSRKSKLEVRDYDDSEEAQNTILQTFLQSSSQQQGSSQLKRRRSSRPLLTEYSPQMSPQSSEPQLFESSHTLTKPPESQQSESTQQKPLKPSNLQLTVSSHQKPQKSSDPKLTELSDQEPQKSSDLQLYESSHYNPQKSFYPQLPKSPEHEALSSPRALDHTYARNVSTPSSALRLSVKVEVEEFDESIIESSISPKPSNDSHPKNKEIKKYIHVFEVNLEKMYKIADRINQSSNNPADKYLSVEIRNIWGRVLKPEDDYDPYNLMVQKALLDWVYSVITGGLRSCRESPLFYQCHICNLAWWYLTPFKDHLNTHDYTKIRVYHQDNIHESNLVVTDSDINMVLYIPCEGNCYRCGKPYNYHVKPPKEMYECNICHDKMETCSIIRSHETDCYNYEMLTVPGELLRRKSHNCTLCNSSFYSNNELFLHMITSHDVRSDVVIQFSFKNCSVCKKKYQHFFMHMCVKSALSSLCMYCYRKFHTKTLQVVHYEMRVENYACMICNDILPSSCMETEHMLTHTEKFRMVYKCINYACPPTIVFPDENSVKMHKVLYHRQKFDKRRSYFEKVVVPTQCIKSDYIQVINKFSDYAAIRIKKISGFDEAVQLQVSEKSQMSEGSQASQVSEVSEVDDWCVPSVPDKQTDKQDDPDDDVIIVKQELEDIETIDIDGQDEDYGPMDYAEMLSKVFKVSDAVRSPPLERVERMHTQIKIEPSDVDYESLDELQEDLITIKQEPIEACLGPSLADAFQTDSCQNDSLNTMRSDSQNDNVQSIRQKGNEISQIESDQSMLYDSCQTDYVSIKTEPQNIEDFDSDISAVKIEPVDIKEEILDCTDANKYTGDNIITADAIFTSPCKVRTYVNKKSIKTPKHVIKNSKSLLKHNLEPSSNETLDTQSTESSPTRNKPVKRKTDRKDKDHKIRMVKYDENGLKIKKLYKCAKCGYKQSHKLFRIHQRSFCEESPTEDKSRPTKPVKFLCTKCNFSFWSLKTYLVHFTKHGYGMLHCPCCNLKFETLKDLIPHFHKHVKQSYVNCWRINDELETTKKQHRCQTCRQIIPPEEFFPHWESHLKLRVEKVEPEEVKFCPVNEPASNNKSLQPATLHLALHQLRTLTREKDCLVCCRKFGRRYDVKRHLIEHLLMDAYTKKDSSPTRLFRCQICLEEFGRAEQYKFHMREHGGLPVYRCDLCDKTFSDSSNFAKHKKIHNMRVLICDICQKKFQAKSSLEKHIIMHMTTDPIKCEHCDRKFFATSHYNKHIHVAHMRSAKFRCIVCDISFDSLKKKWDHAWAVHKERKQKADCPICHKGFRRYIDVKMHAKKEHQLELTFYNIKSDSGVVNKFNIFCDAKKLCKIKKKKKHTAIVVRKDADTSE